MIWNPHSELQGQHALLSASKYHWTNYNDEKLARLYSSHSAARRGEALHAYAQMAIKLKQKQPANGKTVCRYVNDAIGFRMDTEVVLFYSLNAFGTCDAISFRKNLLRIHDLKTGITQTSERQLYVYAVYFCLEYGFKPHEIQMELRIYQNDDVRIYDPDRDELAHIMDRLMTADRIINEKRMEELA